MSSIDKDFIAEINSMTDLSTLVEESILLTRRGANYVANCPFHDEKTASFTVFTKSNTYMCFGCQSKGDAVQWMRSYHHLTFADAVKALAKRNGVEVKYVSSPGDIKNVVTDKDKKALARQYAILEYARSIYQNGLNKAPIYKNYLLSERGFTEETINKFQLGAVAKGIYPFVSIKYPLTELLLESGLFAKDRTNENAYYDRFRYRVMIPIENEHSKLIAFAGRTIGGESSGTSKYINSPDTNLFSKGKELYALNHAKPFIRNEKTAVVVEGYFDVISLHQYGEQRAVSTMGTALTQDQLRKIFRHADIVYFAYDADTGGQRAAQANASLFLENMNDKKSAYFIFLPSGHDPDSFLRQEGLDAWNTILKQALPLSTFLQHMVLNDLHIEIAEQKVIAVQRARDFIQKIKNAQVFQSAVTSQFAEKLQIDASLLSEK